MERIAVVRKQLIGSAKAHSRCNPFGVGRVAAALTGASASATRTSAGRGERRIPEPQHRGPDRGSALSPTNAPNDRASAATSSMGHARGFEGRIDVGPLVGHIMGTVKATPEN